MKNLKFPLTETPVLMCSILLLAILIKMCTNNRYLPTERKTQNDFTSEATNYLKSKQLVKK